jgi:hypothetical protein
MRDVQEHGPGTVFFLGKNEALPQPPVSESTELMKKQGVRNKIKCTANIEMNGLLRGHKIKISYQTDDGKFKFSTTTLTPVTVAELSKV